MYRVYRFRVANLLRSSLKKSRLPIAGTIGRALVILLISGFLGAALIRLAPGSDVDEQELDPRLSKASVESLRRERALRDNPLQFYLHYLGGLLRGDAGQSSLFSRPVSALIGERLPVTIRSVAAGLVAGWCAAVLLAAASVLGRSIAVVFMSTLVSGALISVPAAVLAILCLLLDLPPAAAIAAVVFPRIFPHAYQQLRAGLDKPYVTMARARGLSNMRVFFWHIVPGTLGPIVALAGVSISLALGTSIPVEALADSAGVGQLAWRAALARDLPLLVGITLLLTAVTVAANLLSDIAIARLPGPKL